MSRSRHTEAAMIAAVQQMETGRKAEDVAREVGVSKHTLYAWKAKYSDRRHCGLAALGLDSGRAPCIRIPLGMRSERKSGAMIVRSYNRAEDGGRSSPQLGATGLICFAVRHGWAAGERTTRAADHHPKITGLLDFAEILFAWQTSCAPASKGVQIGQF